METEKEPELMDWREALEFAARFAVTDLGALREGDRLNLIDDIRRYLDVAGTGALARELDAAKKNAELLQPAREAVCKLLEAAVSRQRIEFNTLKEKLVFDGRMLGDERRVVAYDGSIRDVMVETLAADLAELEPWQIARCKECNAIFLVSRKDQKFCQRDCANAAALRAYREAHRPELARKSRENYWRKKLERSDGPQTDRHNRKGAKP
jgi:hypothetical protein